MDSTGTGQPPGIAAGTVIERRYRLAAPLRPTAGTATAEVWRAADLRLHREVAIKLCRSDANGSECDLARANALAGIMHPALAPIFDAGVHAAPEGDRAFVVTELPKGQSLQRRLDYGPLPPRRIAKLGSQLADALAHLHRAGIGHGGICADNVVLQSDGNVKLADLGSVDSTGLPGNPGGTPAEDVRALGLLLFAAFSGSATQPRRPDTGRRVWRRRRLTALAPAGRPRSTDWNELLEAMLAPDPAARPSAAEVAGRLAGLTVAPAADIQGRDELFDVDDDLAPLSVGHWRAPHAPASSSHSRVRLRGGRHRRAESARPGARNRDDAAA